MHDVHSEVRAKVAEYGNKHHLEHLKNDKHPYVSLQASNRYAFHHADEWLPAPEHHFESFIQFTKAQEQ